MRVLLVGAGAIGQVYGYHLQQGGAQVAFLVKPAHVEWAGSGLTLYRLNQGKAPVDFTGYDLFTSPAQALTQPEPWDAVILCVPTDALEKGPWLAELAQGLGSATLVTLQPGIEALSTIYKHVPKAQVVSGLITLVSYPAPLPNEQGFEREGTAYWFPPLASCPFEGPGERVKPLVDCFKKGGFPASAGADLASQSALGSALLLCVITGLEGAGWSFSALRSDGAQLSNVCKSMGQAANVAFKHQGRSPPGLPGWVRPWMLRMALAMAPRFVPFDLETYFRVHFTKVGSQMHGELDRLIARAGELGVPNDSLASLRGRLPAPSPA